VENVHTHSGEIIDSSIHDTNLYCLTLTECRAEVYRFCLVTRTNQLLAALGVINTAAPWLLCMGGCNLSEEFFTMLGCPDSEVRRNKLYILGRVIVVPRIIVADEFYSSMKGPKSYRYNKKSNFSNVFFKYGQQYRYHTATMSSALE
jgi:hypothetical protein